MGRRVKEWSVVIACEQTIKMERDESLIQAMFAISQAYNQYSCTREVQLHSGQWKATNVQNGKFRFTSSGYSSQRGKKTFGTRCCPARMQSKDGPQFDVEMMPKMASFSWQTTT